MPFYRYVAFDGSGRKIKGIMEAESELRAANVLGERGLAVVSLKEVRRRKTFVLFPISIRELASFSRQLATMISAGVRIKEALTILARQEMFSRRFRKVLLETIIDLETGSSLAEALSNRRVFDPVFINLVAAGEEGGVLDKSMEKAAEFYESSKRLQDEIKSAMAYPTFVLVFAIIIVMVISFYILPNLIEAFGGEVPLSPTVSFLMNVNRNLKTNWPIVLIGASLVIIGFVILMKSKAGVYIKDTLSFLFPPALKIRKAMGLERFTRTLGVLIGSGVRLTDAIEMSAKASNNLTIISKAEQIIDSVRKGESLRNAFAESNVFPQLVYEMVGTGEETGKLDEVLQKVADFYEDVVRNSIKRLISLVEPMMIAGVGGFIAFLAYTMYTTIFQMEQMIGR